MKLNQTIAGVAMGMAAAGSVSAQVSTGTSAGGSCVCPGGVIEPLSTDTVGPAAGPHRWAPASGFGMSVMAGGGVTDFTDGAARAATGVGGSWDVRFAFGTRRWVGVEGSYIGGANEIHGLGPANGNATLVRNGLEASLRLNAPTYLKNTVLEPYITAGFGWNGYRVLNINGATASVNANSSNTASVPIAVGFSVGWKGFIADARYTIRPTYRQTTFVTEGSTALTNWDFGGMVGYEF
jgi:hypothetical protein